MAKLEHYQVIFSELVIWGSQPFWVKNFEKIWGILGNLNLNSGEFFN